ncbi:MAG: hypothetical protein M5U28_54285 [Sandaracinaceae bacterium]|nr:hypothetical protein [Sandaracinaceae bacterium]
MKRVAWIALAALAAAGCEVEPFCLTCADGAVDGGGGMDAAAGDAQVIVPDAGPDAGTDGGRPDGCLEAELCNELDDDCDGFVDEGFDLDTNPEHCGECDALCAPPHAFGVCTDGVCGLGDCDVGFYDLDGMPGERLRVPLLGDARGRRLRLQPERRRLRRHGGRGRRLPERPGQLRPLRAGLPLPARLRRLHGRLLHARHVRGGLLRHQRPRRRRLRVLVRARRPADRDVQPRGR